MNLINPIGPFLSPDPTLSQDLATELTNAATGPNPPQGTIITTPLLPLAGLSPDILNPEYQTKGWIFALPWVYLPHDTWIREPGEPAAAWLTRNAWTLLAVDLLAPGDDGLWRGKHLTDIEITDETLPRLFAWADGSQTWEPAEQVRTMITDRLKEANADGREFMVYWASRVSRLMNQGAPVIQGWNTLEYQHDDPLSDNAIRMLHALAEHYPDMYPPAGKHGNPDVKQVENQVKTHWHDGTVLLKTLVANGMEPPETLNQWTGMEGTR